MNSPFPATQPLRSRCCLIRGLRRFLFTLCAFVAATVTKAEADYTFTLIADSTGPFSQFGTSFSLNSVGTVAFRTRFDSEGWGVFSGNGEPLTAIAVSARVFPDFGDPSINSAGTVAFHTTQGSERIVIGNGGPLVTIADTTGQFSDFTAFTSINTAGTVAFYAGQDTGPAGIFTGSGGAVTPVLINSVSLGADSSSLINDAGTVAFRSGNGTRILTINGGFVTTIADSSGALNYFGAKPSLNDTGTVAFVAGMGGVFGGTYGIYSGNGGPLTTIADVSGPFSSFFGFNSNQPSINASGTVAFVAGLDAGGSGLFLGDGIHTIEVIGSGDMLFGSTVTGFAISPTSLNDSGQVAFAYGLADGTTGIAIANPVPEPSASLLLALSFGLSLARRTTRKC